MAANTTPPTSHPEAIIERDEGQFRLRHSDPNDHIWKTVRDTGAFYEAEFLDALGKDLKAGDLVLDVGANIGNHAIYFAGVCDARVIAFEPNPAALTLLKENIAANGLRRRIQVKDYALGSEAGQADFDRSVAASNLGAVRLTMAKDGEAKVRRLDDVDLPAAPRLIKIDAEGMDFDVLRGAETLLKEHQPIVAVEAGNRKNYNEIADFLGELGYIRRESLNYTPTHIFVAVGKTKATQFNRHVARELGGAYVDMATARASVDQRLSRVNWRLSNVENANAKAPAELEAALAAKKAEILSASQEVTATLAADVQRVEASIADVVKTLDKQFTDTHGELAQHKTGLASLAAQLGTLEKATADQRAALAVNVKQLGADIETRFNGASEDYRLGQEAVQRISMRVRELQSALARVADHVGQVTQSVDTRFHETAASLRSQGDAASIIRTKVAELGESLKQVSANLGAVEASIDQRFNETRDDLKLAAEANRLISSRIHGLESGLLDLGSSVADIGTRLDQTRAEMDAGLRRAASQNEVLASAFGTLDESVTARLTTVDAKVDIGNETINRRARDLQTGLTLLNERFEQASQRATAAEQETSSRIAESREAFQAGFGELRKVVADNLDAARTRIEQSEQVSATHFGNLKQHLTDAVKTIETRFETATSALAAGQVNLLDGLGRIDGKLDSRLNALDNQLGRRLTAMEAGLSSIKAAQAHSDTRAERMETDILAGLEISSRVGLWVDRKIEDAEASLAARIADATEQFRQKLAVELRATAEAQLESVGKAVADIMLELDRRQPDPLLPPTPPRRRIDFDDPEGRASMLAPPRAPAVMRPTHVAHEAAAASAPAVAGAEAVKPVARAAAAIRKIDLNAISGEQLAAVDLTTMWKGQGWPQSGSTLQDGGVVQYADGAHWPGFVTAKHPAKSGGVIRVTVEVSDCQPGTNLVARVRNDRDEQCGPDVPLTKGVNVFRVFAPERTRSIKVYALVRPPTSGGSFTIKSIKIDRLDGDEHQRAVRAVVGQPVLASMASIPSRRRMLLDCVNSLLAQCDRVRIFLNNYPDVPDFLNHPRIDVRRSQDWDDRGDAGKVFWIDRDREAGYRLVTDDDLLFPPDFSETMCGKVQAYDNRAIFCTHGVLLRQPVRQYYDPDSRAATFHFARQLDTDVTVHIGATNAMCFHSTAVDMKWSDFSYCNSADIWISLYAQRNRLPVLAASRLQGWVRENTHDAPDDTIYNHSRKRTKSRMDSSLVQDAALRHAAPLTLQPTHRPKLGLAVVVEDVVGLKAFIDGWMAARSAQADWVISLIPATSVETFREAIGNMVIEHETHLFDSEASLDDRIHAARQLAASLGVQATLYVTEKMRFPKAGWEAAVFSPEDAADALLMLRDRAEGGLAVAPFNVRDAHLGKAFVERAREHFALPRATAGADMLKMTGNTSPATASLLSGVFISPSIRAPAVFRKGRKPMGRRINDVFERVVVLNLDRRPDRWAQAQHQLEQAGITAERFSAVDGSVPEVDTEYQEYAALPLIMTPQGQRELRFSEDFYIRPESQAARIAHLEQRSGRKAVASRGAWGYLKSYRTILEQAMKDQVESLLVFDDDVLMHTRTAELFEAASRQLPEDWLLLQLGTLQYNWKTPWFEPVSENLYRTRGSAIGSHAVGIRFDMMPYLLDHASRMDMPFDVGALSAATHAFSDRSFITLPNIAIQRLGAGSDINTSDYQKQTDIAEIAKTYRWNLGDYFPDA